MADFLVIVLAYLLGSVPFGLLLTRLAGLGDIRSIGSGNIGATNVLRTGKKSLAFLTLLLDGAKGGAAFLLADAYMQGLGQVAGAAAFLGHLYPVWLRFKGGKGVATALGVTAAAAWPVAIAAALIWIVTALAFRISSLAALIAVGAAPFLCLFMQRIEALPLIGALAALIFIKHAPNIRRLRDGTEPRIGRKQA